MVKILPKKTSNPNTLDFSVLPSTKSFVLALETFPAFSSAQMSSSMIIQISSCIVTFDTVRTLILFAPISFPFRLEVCKFWFFLLLKTCIVTLFRISRFGSGASFRLFRFKFCITFFQFVFFGIRLVRFWPLFSFLFRT